MAKERDGMRRAGVAVAERDARRAEMKKAKDRKNDKVVQDRSRILFSDRDGMIVFTNFKVGYTSINQVLPKKGWSTEIRLPEHRPLLREKRHYIKTFVYREPQSRLVSYYKNWIVDKAPDYVAPGGTGNHGFLNIKRFFPKSVAKQFYTASHEELCSREFFEMWLENLQYSWHRDRHTQPQHLIYSDFALGIEDMAYVVPLPKLGEWMTKRLELDIGVGNRSHSEELAHFYGEKLSDFARFVYVRDYKDFVGTERL
jgi:hypothetical protein